MLADLAAHYPIVTETFATASDVLALDLWEVVSDGPADRLNQTEITQPAMLAAGVATWRAWRAAGGAYPQWMAGHSLGEYTALVCSGALAFEEAIALTRERGRLMQESVPSGGGLMAAIMGLDDASVGECCERVAGDEVVAPVNFNAPGQVVIAGHAAAVRRAMDAAKEAGAKRAQELAVSVPSHCELMRPAAERLAERLAEAAIQSPEATVIHNSDLGTSSDPDAIRRYLTEQMYRPVRWVETIEAMRGAGVNRLVELGPGKVLSGLNRRIDRQFPIQPVVDNESLESALEQ
jgi:[acyl-carrier-protein] S-malonyltransferase